MTDANTELVLTELRKAIKVEAGDYIVVVDERYVQVDILGLVAEELWKQNIRLHTVLTSDVSAVRFVRVETPETIQVEDK